VPTTRLQVAQKRGTKRPRKSFTLGGKRRAVQTFQKAAKLRYYY
jgi:hypothetical protein